MALGGGTWTAQDKILPGSYINFVAKAATVGIHSRGIAAMGLTLNWGPDDAIFEVTAAEFKKNCRKYFGYATDADEMLNIREIFKGATKLIAYKLNTGGAKASNTFGTAKYKGTRGNDITIVIAANVDDATKFDVVTKLGNVTVDTQTVAAATALVNNDWVDFKTTATLAAATSVMTGGTNGTASGTSHQAFLDALESYSFNALGLDSTDETTLALYVAYVKRLRDTLGMSFQLVVYSNAADYEGVINVKNTVKDSGASAAALTYWTTGKEAGCSLSSSLTNATYDGEYTVSADFTQSQLEEAIMKGQFAFHKVGDEIHVLEDINSLVTYTETKNKYFSMNDVIRTLDDINTSIATLFATSYIGKIRNNNSGRVGLWADIVALHKDLEQLGAIEDFQSSDLTVEEGTDKDSVVVTEAVTVTQAMGKLYMTVTVQ